MVTHEEKIEKVKSILRAHGIKMSVGACGCCDSPWVSFEYAGEKITDRSENFNFDMFSDLEAGNA